MLRSERIPSYVEMMLKMINIAYFYVTLFTYYKIFAPFLQSNSLLKKNVKLTHEKLLQVSSIKFSIECFHYMLMLSLNQLDLCRIGGDWFHCTSQLCIARMWLSRPSISMPKDSLQSTGPNKASSTSKTLFSHCI